MINTVLMDLDGTLLPFDQNEFIASYFKRLCQRMVPLGYAPDDVVKATWAATKTMVQNDGTVLNSERFWDVYTACMGDAILQEKDALDEFYGGAFHEVREVLRGESCAKALVDTLKQKGYTVVLATSPIFPEVAVRSRLSWCGLTPEDFALVTHYDNCHFCKPNPAYYREILQAIGKTPDECLMIGNNVVEDMVAAECGIDVYLVTGFVENPADLPTDGFNQGTLDEFYKTVQGWCDV